MGPEPDVIPYLPPVTCSETAAHFTTSSHAAALCDVVVVDDDFVFLLADRDANVSITSNVLENKGRK